MSQPNHINRANQVIKRISALTDELKTIVTDNELLGEYITSIVKSIEESVSVLNDRVELAMVTDLIETINNQIQPNFKLDIEALLDKKIILTANPSIYQNEDKSSLNLNLILSSHKPVVAETLFLLLASFGCQSDTLNQLISLVQTWYPEPINTNILEDTNTVNIEVEETSPKVIEPTPVVHEPIPVETNEENIINDEERYETEQNNTLNQIVTEETLIEKIDVNVSESRFKDFIGQYMNDHNSVREFLSLKYLVEQEIAKNDKALSKSKIEENVLDIAISTGMDSDNPTSRILLTLAMETVGRNYILEGIRSYTPENTQTTDITPLTISADIQPLLTYLILKHDVVSKKLVGDRNLLEVVYHMFEFDKYKNILSTQTNVKDFYGAVRTVVAIFSRHNWKLNFYQNTLEIQNPPLPMDTWTNVLEDINKTIDRIVISVRAESNPEKVIKLRDIAHSYSPMKDIAVLSLDDATDFIPSLKNHVNEVLANDILIAITTDKMGDISDKKSVLLINKEKNRALLILPNNVYAMTINNGQVMAVTTIGQYDLTSLYEWLTYFELNYGG